MAIATGRKYDAPVFYLLTGPIHRNGCKSALAALLGQIYRLGLSSYKSRGHWNILLELDMETAVLELLSLWFASVAKLDLDYTNVKEQKGFVGISQKDDSPV